MQHKFVLSSDNTGDIRKSYFEKHSIYYILCGYILKGKHVKQVLDTDDEFFAFYNSIKEGALPSTSAINPTEFEEHFKSIIEKNPNTDILHLGLSSGLSNSFNNSVTAADAVNKALGEKRVYAVDTVAATAALDQLVDEARKIRDRGGSIKEAIDFINEIKMRQQGWMLVDDLNHLKRGGRVSGVKAAIGSLLGIKPIVMLNSVGKLAIENKQRGLKRAMEYLVEKFKQYRDDKYKDIPFRILHSSAPEVVEEFKQMLLAVEPNLQIETSIIGPVIGVHVGTGILGFCFVGQPTLNIE